MVKDNAIAVINESIKRMINECMEDPDLHYDVHCPPGVIIDPEELKRLAALCSTMRRIINSAMWN